MKRAEIEGLLPGVFQRAVTPGSPLLALLEAMEALHAPDEEALARLPDYFDPYTAPERLVPFLARWVDLDRLLASRGLEDAGPPIASGLGRLRELIAAAAYLSKWRGTARGLVASLETATGVHGFAVEEGAAAADAGAGRGNPAPTSRPFHIHVLAPAGAQKHQPLIVQIIEMEKPAYVTYELVFRAD